MPDITTAFGQFGSSLQLARVDGYETSLDEAGNSEEAEQNFVPTGRLNITLLSRTETRNGVPFAMGSGGNSSFMGSLPEIGSTCIVGFFEQADPVILGFLPKGLNNLIGARAVIPNMQPGEVLLQASSSDADADGNDQQFVGASVRLDNYGRVIVTTEGYKLITGFLLSDENTPDVSSQNDPITGEAIFLMETGPGGMQRRVGSGGSTVWQYGKDKHERIGGDVETHVEGQIVVIARAGQSYTDKRGNQFGIDTEGNVFVEAASGGFSMSATGPATYEASNESYNTLREYKRVVGGNHSTVVGGNRTLTIGSPAAAPPNGDVIFNLGLAGSQEYVAGAKLISSTMGMVLSAGILPPPFAAIPTGFPPILPGGIVLVGASAISLTAPQVFLGGPAAVDPVVKFTELAAFLTALLTLLASSPTPPPGVPLLPAASGLVATIATLQSAQVRVLS